MNHSIQFIFFYFVNIESVHSFDDRFLLFQSVKANFSPFVHLVVSKIDIKYIYEMKRTHIRTHACHQAPNMDLISPLVLHDHTAQLIVFEFIDIDCISSFVSLKRNSERRATLMNVCVCMGAVEGYWLRNFY